MRTLPVRMVTAALSCPSALPFLRPGVTALARLAESTTSSAA